ncbi:uncharacterized protein LOC107412112 [Ziziphus jujuba]|nr:uncharacterized protein LOC107412112 [Ziziphus jujuba]XP_048324010.1 uncharacterized protein LOC107412112 [Ziziphus jujuba]
MECNKEEAMRAMQLAETKMQNKDFTGAMKFAQKAQRLFPELDKISHLLAVCEVHCSAEKKMGVSEMDWYGVLQIEQTVDDATIRKQYRKLALLLHPDKNKFAGAEAAFKLIGEANRVLTDHSKRSIYDMKYRGLMRTAVVNPSLHQSNGSTSVQNHYGTANNQHNIPHPQSTGWQSYQQTTLLTFWTCCPYCKIRFQYYRNFVNRVLSCHSCSQHFVAQDLGSQGVPPRSFQSQFDNQKEAQNQGPPKVSSHNSKGNHSGTKFQDRFSSFHPASKTGNAAEHSGRPKMEGKDKQHVDVGVGKKGAEMPKSNPAKSKEPDTSKNANRKRRKKVVESSESCETGNTNDTEDVTQENVIDSSTPCEGDNPRRSSRQKQNVSYRENVSDDDKDFASRPKKPRETISSCASDENMKKASVHGGVAKDDGSAAAASMDGHEKEVKHNLTVPVEESLPSKIKKTCESEVKEEEAVISDHLDQNCKADDGAEVKSSHMSGPQILTYPDPEFNDFDKDKAENCFAINQVWAIYDTFDGMPRFYARIKKVFSPGFKLLISWFEADPDDQSEIDWCDQDLPVACGKYRIGGTDETEDRLMFSHRMQCVKGRGRGTYMVYPRKGETWALYQNWDISWVSDPQKHMPYEFEYVEVLSDFVEDSGITVAYLSKVKGFVSLFQLSNQHGIMSFQVPPNELYRFSHRIPSFKMTGDEREDVPRGSFELDPAALSNNLSMFGDHSDVKKDIGSTATEAGNFCPNSLESDVKPVMGSERIPAAKKHDNKDLKRESPISRRSPGKPNSSKTNYGKIDANEAVAADSVKDIKRTSLTTTVGSAPPSQVDERVNTPRKQGKKNHGSEPFELRRSPRDLSKKLSQENAGQFAPDLVTTMNSDSNKDESNGCTRFKEDTTSSCSGGMTKSSRKMHSKSPRKCPITPSSASPVFKPSNVEGFDIDHPKSKEKFQLGQIWALYSDRDGMPRTYVQVKRIQSAPDFLLHVALLEPCSQPKDTSRPVSCGTFIVKDGETKVFPCSSFSHCLSAKHVGKNRYEINPQIGEVWALYKNQNPISASSSTGEAEFDIVEVLEVSGKSTKVVVLSRVDGYKSMFKAPRIQRSKTGVIEIPRSDAARFSHKIPSYKHTGENDSRLLGYWELDPLSIHGIIVCLD